MVSAGGHHQLSLQLPTAILITCQRVTQSCLAAAFMLYLVLLACKVGQHEHLSAWVFISGEAHACYSVFSSISM